MKPTFTRPATLADAHDVARRLRQPDRDEVLAAGGVSAEFILPSFVDRGSEVYASGIEELGRPEVLFGVSPIVGVDRGATIWLLGTDTLFDYPVEFAVNSRIWFERFHERYDLLTNFIDARNERHLKWLKWLGFVAVRQWDRFGAHGLPFIEFASYRPCANPQP